MNKIKDIISVLAIAASLALTAVSCINEDLSACIPSLRVYFDYNADSKTGYYVIDPSKLYSLHLLVFNENGELVDEEVDNTPKLSTDYFMEVKGLRDGRYTFVAWGNIGGKHYAFSDNPSLGHYIDSLNIKLACINDGVIDEQIEHLFYASHQDQCLNIDKDVNLVRLQLEDNTYDLHITVEGIDSLDAAANNYAAVITDNNGQYDFENNIWDASDRFSYIQPFVWSPPLQNDAQPSIHTETAVLGLSAHSSQILDVRAESGENIVHDNIIETITKVYAASGVRLDFGAVREFNLLYTVNHTPKTGWVIVSITVNGWRYIPQSNTEL
jgi:hypothetical protein